VRVEDDGDHLLDVREVVRVVHARAVVAGDVEGVAREVALHVHLRLLHVQSEVLQSALHELQDARAVRRADADDGLRGIGRSVDDDLELIVALALRLLRAFPRGRDGGDARRAEATRARGHDRATRQSARRSKPARAPTEGDGRAAGKRRARAADGGRRESRRRRRRHVETDGRGANNRRGWMREQGTNARRLQWTRREGEAGHFNFSREPEPEIISPRGKRTTFSCTFFF